MLQEFSTPLCVDLDGTLVETNTLFEATISALKKNPLRVFVLFFTVFKGKAAVKHQIGEYASGEKFVWLYNSKFLTFLRIEHARGRKLILATASDKTIADAIAAELGIFDEVIASTPLTPVTASKKYIVLQERFGNKNFSYAGNSHDDLSVWNNAASAVIVHASERVASVVRKHIAVEAEFSSNKKIRIQDVLQEMRAHQWLKNLLLFVPLIMAHRIEDQGAFFAAIVGFFSFSLLASSMYVMNDLLDISSDRAHPTKYLRPIAFGTIPIQEALLLIAFLVISSFALAFFFLPSAFSFMLLLYIAINAVYSLRAKKIPYIDITILAGLYVLRIIAGSAATGIATSSWLFVFAGCFFFYLASMKRVVELLQLKQKTDIAPGRGYNKRDTEPLIALGMTFSLFSCIVLGLYVRSDSVTLLYARPTLLWALLPLIIIWIIRMWYITLSKKMLDDPVLFTSKDAISYVIGLSTIGVLVLATL